MMTLKLMRLGRVQLFPIKSATIMYKDDPEFAQLLGQHPDLANIRARVADLPHVYLIYENDKAYIVNDAGQTVTTI